MRSKLFMTMLVFLAMLLNAHADTVSVDDVHLLPGGQAQVTVRLHSYSNIQYVAWQMDFLLPDGISTVVNAQGLLQGQLGDCCDETFSLFANHLSDGIDRWVTLPASADITHTISASGNVILFTFPITAAETLKSGTILTATVENIIFANLEGTKNIYMDDVTFTITIDEKPQPWVFDLQASIDSVATSANLGTASNPVQIKIPNEYLITSPITVHDKVFIRLTGGTLKLSGTFATSNDYVFLIEGGPGNKSTLYLKDVTVDANSRELHYSFFKIQGDLYVESGVTYKNINAQTGKDNGAFYLNEGTLYVQTGTVSIAGNPIRGGGYTYISGGVLKGNSCVNMNGDWKQGVRMGSGPGVEISGGELVATGIAILPLESTYSGSATISGGKISAPSLMKEGKYCYLYITGGQIDVIRLLTMSGEPSISGTQVFISGNVELDIQMNVGIHARSVLTKPWVFDCSLTNFNTIKMNTGGFDFGNGSFEEKTLVIGDNYDLQPSDFEKMTFTGVPDSLVIYYNEEDLSVNVRLKNKPVYVGMLGDVNNDGVVSISDAICIISWLQENTLPVFIEGAADYNKDGGITVSDALAIIQMLLTLEPDPVIPDIPDDDISQLIPTTSAKGIDINLSNDAKYTAFTMDVALPEGMTVNDISLDRKRAPRHQLVFNKLSDGRYRIIGFSPTLDSFNGNNGTLLTIKTNKKGIGKIGIDNVHFVDLNAQEYSLNASPGNTTGIDIVDSETRVYANGSDIIVEADKDMNVNVYTVSGLLYKTLDVKAGRNVFDGNDAGIYIANGVKLIIK